MKKTVLFAILSIGLVFSSCKKEVIEPVNQSIDNIETIDIGDWNMDAEIGVQISLPNPNGIISVDVLIYSDNGNETSLFSDGNYMTENGSIFIYRKENGYFDQSAFSNSTINRGIITIHYE